VLPGGVAVALTSTLNVRLTPEERAELEQLAARIDRSPSWVVRELIRSKLEQARNAEEHSVRA
jgi:predicted transcriptional regulator